MAMLKVPFFPSTPGRRWSVALCLAISPVVLSYLLAPSAIAQTTLPAPDLSRPLLRPSATPQPELPPPEVLIPSPSTAPNSTLPTDLSTTIVVKQFEIVGSTVFSPQELATVTQPLTNRPINFTELLEAANRVTELYRSKGYLNSGAYIPSNQTFSAKGGVVRIAIVEGRVTNIVVTGTKRLNPNYIRNRIGLGTRKPLKVDRLIESLRLLQLDPLIQNISTELVPGLEPGTSILRISVTETPTWQAGFTFNNNRVPSVGELQALATISQNNLTGNGDSLAVTYGRSEASNLLDLSYSLPLNPHNGTIKLQYSLSNSRVIEPPFDRLDINGTAQDVAVSYRQPIIQNTNQEFALGVTVAHRQTNTGYLLAVIGERVGYPSPGADEGGNTRLTAARFFQEYTLRDTQQVFAARSQFSVGLNAFGATTAATAPDSSFVHWRGQAQYVRALNPNSIILIKLEGQVADRPLLALEQIGLGGQDTVRGYRQDVLLGDSGLLASAEVRFPIFTPADSTTVLQIVPFVDVGVVWNQGTNPTPKNNAIASGGIGLRYQNGENLSARLDYGIPFTNLDRPQRTGQENGLHFSLNYRHSF
jgi:hemolysin activation/secretion protein